ncbi:MAG: Fic family protein [Planctomycetota bacterium]
MLEGAATTRDEAKRMLRSGRDPRTRGERMVLNNYRAIMFVREHAKQDLTPEMLVRLQSIVTEQTLDDPGEAGRFRNEHDRIVIVSPEGEVVHTPPPASELHDRVLRLCDFANRPIDRGEFVHPVLKACALRFQIGFDHPFCDGNGRTARAIFYWSMLRSGYWLFEYLPISRLILQAPARYARAYLYTETDENDLTYFFVYHLNVIKRARKDLAAYIDRKRSAHSDALLLIADDPELNPRQRDAIVWLLRNPGQSLDIASHRSDHNVAYDTARTDLRDLARRGYLVERKSGKRLLFTPGPRSTR